MATRSSRSGSTDPAGNAIRGEMTPARIDALIRLLGDDDPHIRGVVRGHLRDAIEVARPHLVERSRQDSDPRVREGARTFLLELARAERLREWEHLVENALVPGVPDLEAGAFLIAAAEEPDLDIHRYRRLLDDCGVVLSRRVSPSRHPDAVAKKLLHLLFREMGLQGNRESYYDPENSYLHRVLDRKLGIPISLSVIAILVARRVGLELEGVGLPGHFLVRYRSGHREVYLDPFNAGRVWTLEDCLQHLRGEGYAVDEHALRAYTAREILIRMLMNLHEIFRQRQDEERLGRITAMLESLG